MQSDTNIKRGWTQGEWRLRIDGTATGRGPEIVGDDGYYTDGSPLVIADCGTTEVNNAGSRDPDAWVREDNADEIWANANLMGAAPDLYAVLEEVMPDGVTIRGDTFNAEGWLAKATAALKKARGES